MPGVNALDFLVWRKASSLYSSIPVIVLSGSNEPIGVGRILELGANQHIAKPMDLEGWEKVVREIWDFGTQARSLF